MRLFIAIIFWIAGAGVMVYGLWHAIAELGAVYQGALNNPLEQPENAEKIFSENMIRSLLIAAAGIPFLVIGTIMLRFGGARRRRERRLARGAK